jgi:hypothetical protein
MFGVFRDEKEMLATVECVKQKDGELIEPVTFSMRVTELAKDEDGDPITSLVASAVGSTVDIVDAMKHEAQRGRGGRNHLFLDLAQNGIEEKKLRPCSTRPSRATPTPSARPTSGPANGHLEQPHRGRAGCRHPVGGVT